MDASAQRIEVRPQPGPQEAFLASPADIVIYGGAAGGGKTWALLLDQLRDVDVRGFRAMIFRRTYPEITNAGGMWDESDKLYPHAGGTGVRGDLVWRFRSGARVEFGHLQHENELSKYDGAQIPSLDFDQLEHFSERMFWYMQVRNRTNCSVPARLRATCNPDPDSWLISGKSGWGSGFLAWWIGEDGYAILERSGVIRWVVRYREELYWADTREELEARFAYLPEEDRPIPLSVTFIVATIYDNQVLLRNDKTYLAKLKALPLVERERFLGDAQRGGNWKVKPEAGKVFNRSWFEVISEAPEGGVDCRFWDLAATEKNLKNNDPDFTTGVKVRKVGGHYIVLDMINERIAAGEIDDLILDTAKRDTEIAKAAGARYRVRWETEPGGAGVRETARVKRLLAGYDADGVPSTKDKITRARYPSSEANLGHAKVVASTWTDLFLAHLHGFPDADHDDIPDAYDGAVNELANVTDEVPAEETPNPWTRRRNL